MSKGQAILHTFLIPFVLIVFLLLLSSLVLIPYTLRHAQTMKVEATSEKVMHDYFLLLLLKSQMTPTTSFGEYFASRPTDNKEALTNALRPFIRGCFHSWKFSVYDGDTLYYEDNQLDVFSENVVGGEYVSCPRKTTSEIFLPQLGSSYPLRIELITCSGENKCG